MKRFAGSLFLVVLALPLFARVVSYAPYTNRVATPSFQERTARHFVLIETTPERYWWNSANDLVLYDSSGAEEPRLISPRPDSRTLQAALYQKEGAAPLILAITSNQLYVSEGGENWKGVQGIAGSISTVDTLDVDTGGPFTHGLFAPITLGDNRWPFVVTLASRGVWAIDAGGRSTQLFGVGGRVIGRNAAGTRFLIYSANALWSASPEGELARVANLQYSGYYAGWLTSDGTAYVVARTMSSRILFKSNPRTMAIEVIGGAEHVAWPPHGSTIPPLRWFAVPTHDYEGAWIIERGPGRPTTLYRHTAAGGLERMWSDPSAPQVEALIAGRSGETLLVQVHREREGVELSSPFIDPALAVWRVGEPAPKIYDELYLNEEWNKGFVCVDPDRIEIGQTFVFNSGFKLIEPTPSRVSAPIGGGGDVIQEWGVVRGSLKQKLVLPGVARLSGAFASFWATDVTIYNPTAESQDVEVRFAAVGAESFVTTTLSLAPREIRTIPDVLKTLFSLESGGGTLHLLPAVGVNAIARTYTRKGGGTFGFGMQAIDAFSSIGPRFKVSFSGAFPGDNFRTNVLLTDTSGRGTHANLRAYSEAGELAVTGAGLATPAQGTMQLNTISGNVGLNALQGGALVVEPTRGTAIPTVVAIDNRTNDPTYFPPDVPGTIPRSIPVIGNLDGAHGAKFRSDLYLYNPGPNWRSVFLQARPWNGSWRIPARLYLRPYESRVVHDALKTLFGTEGLAHLRYASQEGETGEAVRVTSRTYTVNADGGTYGCLVPPLNGFQIGTRGDRLEILGISAGPGFRTNIGLVDLADNTRTDPTVRLTIIDGEGRTLDTMTVRVPARGGVQYTDIFTARRIPPPAAALLVVEIVDGQQIAAYATLTDNTTNDSIYLGSILGAKPEQN